MVTDHIAQRWGLGQHEHQHREVVGHHTASIYSTMFVNKHLSLDNILQWFFSPIICNHLPTFSRGEPNIVNKQLSLDGNLQWLYQLVVSQKPDIINYKANIFDNLNLLPKNHLQRPHWRRSWHCCGALVRHKGQGWGDPCIEILALRSLLWNTSKVPSFRYFNRCLSLELMLCKIGWYLHFHFQWVHIRWLTTWSPSTPTPLASL